MNYSRGLNPSCMSETAFKNMNLKKWKSVKDNTPPEGMPILILDHGSTNDPDFWVTDIAYYCDGGFYNLQLDPRLGVLRKEFVKEPVKYWAHYIVPSPAEIKE